MIQDISTKTLSSIVTEHYQAAKVFQEYGLDFCCKGKRPLTDACNEKNIPVEKILEDLYKSMETETYSPDFQKMSLTELSEYIVRVHHTYTKVNMPQIAAYIEKVALKHGNSFPYMTEVSSLFNELKAEMEEHMMKEEKILFPKIKLLEINFSENASASYIQAPIRVMEMEHDHAGEIMSKIRTLTDDYSAPVSACTTFRLSLQALKAFEEDLHQHVHLENNILFPKALRQFSSAA